MNQEIFSNRDGQEPIAESQNVETGPAHEKTEPSRFQKITRSVLVAAAMAGVFGKSENPASAVEPKPAATSSLETAGASAENKVSKVLGRLNEIAFGESSSSEQRWLAQSASEQIRERSELAEQLMQEFPADKLPPPKYLGAFITDKKVSKELKDKTWAEFHSFHYGKNRKETKEFLEMTIEGRFKKLHEIESREIYSHFIKTEGTLFANLRVMKANQLWQKHQTEEGIKILKRLIDMQSGKEITEMDEVFGPLEDLKKVQESMKKVEKEIEKRKGDEGQGKAIKEFLERLTEQ